ncbi:Ras subfamily protein [Acanthamoeba castellanii str. Neff]|uniref:Ras subfamily protein n=1 Tax=Acanthamoeba castellanii (strain ATCC 30010 / Neff) TaxID=1257118 RepID=L8GQT2_ACACF|nr:Ras subfamily protein [Acanthamoeba castellanii str. Neff]ELR15509.1 Ras subfamily protein [Acanthamoeba castellanii str. Neff]
MQDVARREQTWGHNQQRPPGRSAREILMLDAQEGLEGDIAPTPAATSTVLDAAGGSSSAAMNKRTRSASAAVVGTSHMAARLALSPPHARKSRDFLRFNSQSPSSSKSKSPNGDDDYFSPTSLRDQCIYFIIAHSYALSPSSSPFSSSNNNSRSLSFLISILYFLRILLFIFSSSSSSSPPSRSATYASLPTRGRPWDLEEATDRRDHHDIDDFYGPLATSSPIPLSLRQRASAAEPRPVDLGMAMLLSPPLRQQQRKTELVYRVVLVGDDCVGKTSICDMWKTGKCQPSSLCECTMGAAFFHREVTIDDYTVRLEVWDSGGQARFDNLTPMYITEADGVIAVYDVCSSESFEKAKYWVDQALTIKRGAPLRIILAGNKTDLLPSSSEFVVPHEVAEEYARSSEVDGWLPVSARNNLNINALFKNMANCLVEAERARINRKIVASLDIQPTARRSDAVSVSFKGVQGPLALAPVVGMRMGLLPMLPWLPDTAASACMLCSTNFSVTKRVRPFNPRHHCRRCGRVTCNRCSRHRTVLPSRATDSASPSSSASITSSPSSPGKSPARAAAERVCDHCAEVVACWTALHS